MCWIFGYGSLIWKVDFPYESKLLGFIEGYDRRFYQRATEHRGTPERPGRGLTLIPSRNEKSRVYGVAYKISKTDVQYVINHLDYREKNGYEKKSVIFYPTDADKNPLETTIYIVTEGSENYAGPATIDTIASEVVKAFGSSGSNAEYVYNLAEAMRCLFPDTEDDHLFALERMVLRLLKFEKGICA